MARPRGFDEETAVDRAIEVFWRRGYHATSTRDLGEALELNPSSLYRTFGDKHRLFLRALDHYRATESTEGCQRFRDAAPTMDALIGTVTAVAGGAPRVEASIRPRAGIDRERAASLSAALSTLGRPDAQSRYRIAWPVAR